MEKRKWLWKKKSGEKSPGETESSESISSHSERNSDDQESFKASPNCNTQSPEVTSKAVDSAEDVNDTMRRLKEKLSAALVNVSAKDELVKQHAKVAEEAVAGWEKAENEAVALKQQIEDAVERNSALEDRLSHVDGALKECVRQLRQAREEQEQKITEAVLKKTLEWETAKSELETQLLELQRNSEATSHADPDLFHKLESLERENSALKLELHSLSEDIEIRTIERDLSTQAAETASKQHLESIKKVAKLEAECRRLKLTACKSTAASSIYVDSLTDSHSDSGEQLIMVDSDTRKMSNSEPIRHEPSCSDSWASALIAELDQFKNEKAVNRNITASSIEIDLMDDFLEMERLAALPEPQNGSRSLDSKAVVKQTCDEESSLRAELEAMTYRVAELEEKLQEVEAEKAELEAMAYRAADLEEKLLKVEAEKAEMEEKLKQDEIEKDELEAMAHQAAELGKQLQKVESEKVELDMALNKSQACIESSQLKLAEVEMKLENLQRELQMANESKQSIETQLIGMEVETWTMCAKVDTLESEVQKERVLSEEIASKCRELEEELARKEQETVENSNGERKIKQEELAVAAGKLAECQKTIASLGNQLKSLATLEDFLIDTPSLPVISGKEALVSSPRDDGEWRLHSNETYSPKRGSDASRIASENSGASVNKNDKNSPPSSSSSSTSYAVPLNHSGSDKNRSGFAKFFTRSKSGIHLEI